jgi:hypothetical protein
MISSFKWHTLQINHETLSVSHLSNLPLCLDTDHRNPIIALSKPNQTVSKTSTMILTIFTAVNTPAFTGTHDLCVSLCTWGPSAREYGRIHGGNMVRVKDCCDLLEERGVHYCGTRNASHSNHPRWNKAIGPQETGIMDYCNIRNISHTARPVKYIK